MTWGFLHIPQPGSIQIGDSREEADAILKDSILEAQVEAPLQGHNLGSFKAVDTITGGYEAGCKFCGLTSWVGDNGLRYSLLEDKCPEHRKRGNGAKTS